MPADPRSNRGTTNRNEKAAIHWRGVLQFDERPTETDVSVFVKPVTFMGVGYDEEKIYHYVVVNGPVYHGDSKGAIFCVTRCAKLTDLVVVGVDQAHPVTCIECLSRMGEK